MIDDFISFFMAGQESISNTLTLTFWELGRHPEIVKKFYFLFFFVSQFSFFNKEKNIKLEPEMKLTK